MIGEVLIHLPDVHAGDEAERGLKVRAAVEIVCPLLKMQAGIFERGEIIRTGEVRQTWNAGLAVNGLAGQDEIVGESYARVDGSKKFVSRAQIIRGGHEPDIRLFSQVPLHAEHADRGVMAVFFVGGRESSSREAVVHREKTSLPRT